jgi:hypothetical protein
VDPTTAARRAGALLVVEGAALTLLGVADAVATVVGSPEDTVASAGVAVFAAAVGVLLLGLGRAVWRRRGWARTPAIVLQLLALPVGTDQVRAGAWPIGGAVLLLAGVTLFHLALARRE